MIKGKNILCIIPARGGSKGIPDKNLQRVGKASLVERAIRVAKASKFIDRIIVSTDSERIRRVSKQCGGSEIVPFLRPNHLAKDKTPSLPVFQHALEWAEKQDQIKYDIILVLEPTCPFRLPTHLRKACVLAVNHPLASSVVSLVEVGDHHPVRIKKISKSNKILPFCINEPEGLRRQDQEKAYIRNGALYVFRAKTLKNNRLWGDHSLALKMDESLYSINIDHPLDLTLANEFWKQMKKASRLKEIEV